MVRPPSTVTPPTSSNADLGAASAAVSRIDQYDLIYRLGTGGMGNVYLARRRNQSGLQRLFAVKAMHPLLSADAEFANMFLDEAHIASRLHHINVVGIVDLGRFGGRLFLVMDYVEGPTLAQLLAGSAERPPALLCAIVIDMLHGLQAAHSLTSETGEALELVHRDVSPSNILVGTDGVARLTDFGIAKARLRRTSTSPGVRKGKLCYSAPEQITNPGDEDSRVDVFAAGIVLWNALTGTRLFDGDNEAAVILSVVNRPIPAPSTVGRRPPRFLDEVCLRALDRDPARRYASAAEMAEHLRLVTRAHSMVAGPEQVATWVATLFGDELERRRAAVRAIAAGAGEPAGQPMFARGTVPQAPELEPEYAEIALSWPGEAPTSERPRRIYRWAIPLLAVVGMSAAFIAHGIHRRVGGERRRAAPVAPAVARPPASAASSPAPGPANRARAIDVPSTAPAPIRAAARAPTPAAAAVAPADTATHANTAPHADTAPRADTATHADPTTHADTTMHAGTDGDTDVRTEPPAGHRPARKHRPARPVVTHRPPPRSAATTAAEEDAKPAAPAPPPEPDRGDAVENNPYLRRGSPAGRR
jgi:eukaryotic-like serine/threonine-protein kinase